MTGRYVQNKARAEFLGSKVQCTVLKLKLLLAKVRASPERGEMDSR